MSNAPAPTAPVVVQQGEVLTAVIERWQPVFASLLARTDTDEATFKAWIGNALRSTPKLWQCEPATTLGAALRCAQLNLPPNDGNNLAWIIPRENRREGRMEAGFQLGYGGVLELARRAMPGIRFEGRPVYPHDEFSLDFGKPLGEQLHHRPAVALGKSRGGEAFAWYVRAIFPSTVGGGELVHVLDREGVEYHRSFSKRKDDDMWKNSYDAAALKSVVLDMRRWLPHTPLLAEAVASDGSVHDVRDMEQAGAIVHKQDEPDALAPGGER